MRAVAQITRAPKNRTYILRHEMRRIADALFELADKHKSTDAGVALACYKEARLLADVAVKASLAGPEAAKSVQAALTRIDNRVRLQQALERKRGVPINMIPEPEASQGEHDE